MSSAWLENLVTPEEERDFAENGYMVIEDAIPQDLVERATRVVDRLTADQKAKEGLGPKDGINIFDFIGKDDVFLELLDYPTTFPKVWGILGWNIQLYHSHYDYHASQRGFGAGAAGAELAQGQRAAEQRTGDGPAAADFAEGGVFPDGHERAGAGESVCDTGQSSPQQAAGR